MIYTVSHARRYTIHIARVIPSNELPLLVLCNKDKATLYKVDDISGLLDINTIDNFLLSLLLVYILLLLLACTN